MLLVLELGWDTDQLGDRDRNSTHPHPHGLFPAPVEPGADSAVWYRDNKEINGYPTKGEKGWGTEGARQDLWVREGFLPWDRE